MKILRDDTFAHRGGPRRPGGVHAALLFMLVFVSIALMVLSRLQHPFTKDVRAQFENLVAPVLNAAVVPLTPVRRLLARVSAYTDLYAELDRLKEENQRMKGWEWKARELERKYSQLGKLAHVVEEQLAAPSQHCPVEDREPVSCIRLLLIRSHLAHFNKLTANTNARVSRQVENQAAHRLKTGPHKPPTR